MKLMRVGTTGAERPALLDDGGTIRDLSGVVDDKLMLRVGPEQYEKVLAG